MPDTRFTNCHYSAPGLPDRSAVGSGDRRDARICQRRSAHRTADGAGQRAFGLAVRAEQSLYVDGGTRYDLRPLSTRIAGVKIGKPFNDQLNGWPLNIVGYVGVLQHDCRGLAPKGLQLDAFMTTYFYAVP